MWGVDGESLVFEMVKPGFAFEIVFCGGIDGQRRSHLRHPLLVLWGKEGVG